ncbi:MAG: MFS transporter [Anaerovoracaceae bacterium]
MKKLLNIDYSLVQGTYWMYFGVVGSFASVFLLDRGYSNSDIGLILALGSVLAVILQPFMADIADRSKKLSLIGIIELMVLALVVSTLGLFIFETKSMALSAVFIFLYGWQTAIQPLVNSLSFKLEESGVHINFGVARSIGSLAYAGLCAILGSMVTKFGITAIPVTGEIVLILMAVALVMTKINFGKGKAKATSSGEDGTLSGELTGEQKGITLLEFIKRNKAFLIVNLGVIGLFFSNSVLNNFMIQIVTNVGGDSGDMGRMFSLMAALEIPTMVFFDKIRRRFTSQFLIKFAALAFAVKIGLCFVATNVTMLYLAQLIQLASFALFLPAMVHFIDEIMSRGEAVKGQALYTIMTTVGSIFASLVGGVILDLSGAKMLLLVSTIVTLGGALIIVFALNKVKSKV